MEGSGSARLPVAAEEEKKDNGAVVVLFGTVQFDAIGMVDNFIIHYGPGRDWFERLQIRSHFFFWL